MNRELRAKAVESAAARYGAEHYRGILFWQTFGKLWPVAVLVAIVVGIGWAGTHVSAPSNALIGFGVAGLAVLGLLYLGIRRLRSPYRRRRF